LRGWGGVLGGVLLEMAGRLVRQGFGVFWLVLRSAQS
jgi:hypothetical protein